MDGIKIKLMQKKDIKPLSKIYTLVYTYFDVGEKWDEKSSSKLLTYWYNRQRDMCLVAYLNNKPIGAFVAGIKPWHNGNHLVDGEIFVHPKYQQKGIGKMLSIEMYERALKRYAVSCFDGITFKNKKFPLSWYKSQGFTEITNLTLITGDLKKVLTKLKK